MKQKRYYYFYKIVNLINNKFYYGVHSTDDLDDGYMGSGTILHKAYKKYGVENFEKTILQFFDNMNDMYAYEKKIVTEELVKDKNCHNQMTGGIAGGQPGTVVVRDANGLAFRVDLDDPRYISGELKQNTVGKAVVRVEGGFMQIDVNDPEYKKYESINKGYAVIRKGDKNYRVKTTSLNYDKNQHINKHKVVVRNEDGSFEQISMDDERYTSGRFVGTTKGIAYAKLQNGGIISTTKDDPRFLSGELSGFRKGLVTVVDSDGNKLTVSNKDPRFLSGELKSITSGRVYVKKDGICKHPRLSELQDYLNDGWVIGKILRKHKNVNKRTQSQ